MISQSKVISIVFLLLVIFISLLFQKKIFENFDNSTYSASLLNTLGPIIFDSSTLSTSKISSLQKLNPPITDKTILSYLNSGTDSDGIISNIKTYLGSCPTNSST